MESEKLEQVWRAVCDQVKSYNNIDPSQINAFFSRLQPQAMSEDFLMLTADNDFIKTWIERHYVDFIKQALMDLYRTAFTVLIEVDIAAEAAGAAQGTVASAPAASSSATMAPAGAPAAAAEGAPAGVGGYTAGSPTTSQPPSQQTAAEQPPIASQIADAYEPVGDDALGDVYQDEDEPGGPDRPTSTLTFENFVIGDSNRMAYSMAVAVAEMPGKAHLNPLFIYGKSGLGKTHLLRAIQNYVHETMPNLSTIYVDSAELLSDYMEASAAHDKEKSSYKNFKTRYEEADVLLIDDVQYLQGKKQTLDIVFQIFNKLTGQGRQVVLSADRAPKNIDIDERYKSRFNSGGTFDIQPPEIETKLGIVKSFVDEYRATEGKASFSIPDDIQMYIAESSSSNIRELKSAVTKVIYQMTFFNQPDLSLDDVRSLLENHFSGGPSKRLTIADIQKEVETFYKVSHADLVGKKRTRNIIYARQIAIYLSRQMLDLPFNDIGKKFNRDHSTVMYSVTNVEEKMKESRELREELETLKQLIREI
ncbi:chromosomal replication initiator protein DnaA [Gordonibacter urolithinfaciens]|jgi:chromosomal replication initiator protein|uniref:Chromosomal replication initiator protein DnaA n=1 Tax=Gordonibacter urolithinfaciens TaxID=1335613 RepID=A0A423UNL5_9ACTN|nr:chromosomal replication initiator protein DnaA [Gordonibacter urolithinfaciens]MBS6974462.1 chromosomal replication initiator protein DnaA [Eggerthellaceae bacterium]MCB6560683.1 chromosomal replication initiator protein DnaA [Gordonibacter urolithinfaciens]MCB7086242.1 chromosomal replication initiator protein DnaA [Gordonibacter urolithinfaciens]MSA94711.1 chromosomal replication initiator protein DnaA [Gordonibacter urolithinfaciens]ROT92009.1 chromosomal replication initiator protein Dn